MKFDIAKTQTVMADKKISNAELSRISGIARPHITRLLSGKHQPTLETITRIAKALNCPLPQLLA